MCIRISLDIFYIKVYNFTKIMCISHKRSGKMALSSFLGEAKRIAQNADNLLQKVSWSHSDEVAEFKSKFSFCECMAFNIAGAFVHFGYVNREKEEFLDSVIKEFNLTKPASYYLDLQSTKAGNDYYEYDVKYGHKFDYLDSIWMYLFKFGQGYAGVDIISEIVNPYAILLISVMNDGNNVPDDKLTFIMDLPQSFSWALECIQNHRDIPLTSQTKKPVNNTQSFDTGRSFTNSASGSFNNSPSPLSSNSSEELPLQITKVGGSLGQISRDNDRTVSVGIDIYNPNKDKMAVLVTVEITLSDSNGNVVDVINDTLYYIDAGSTFHYGYEKVWVKGNVSKISGNAYARGFVNVGNTYLDGTAFTNCSLNNDNSSDTCTVSGLLKSGYTKPIYDFKMYYQVLSSNGEIVGGDNVYVDVLPAGQSRSISNDHSLRIQNGNSIVHSVDFQYTKYL